MTYLTDNDPDAASVDIAEDMLAALISFLSACAESYPDGENAGLFPPDVAEWAAEHSDEIAMTELEMDR